MKSIKQIFKSNEHLMDIPPVEELVGYAMELEDEIVEYKQRLDQTVILKQIIFEIKKSCDDLLSLDEMSTRRSSDVEKPDFKESIVNLSKYIKEYCYINKINLF